MSDVYIGEIRPFAFPSFAPQGFAFCNGQLLSIQQFTALFSILGTTYGGNGTSNFQLPNLQGMAPMHQGTNSATGTTFVLGETNGSSTVQLNSNEMPQHNHSWQVSESGTLQTPTPNNTTWLGLGGQAKEFIPTTAPITNMSGQAIGLTGNSLPHENMQPYLTINFCVALQGVFPSRN